MMLRGGSCCWSQSWGERDTEDAQDVLFTEPEQPADPDPQAQTVFLSLFCFSYLVFFFFLRIIH